MVLVSACRFMVDAAAISSAGINQLQCVLPMEHIELIGRIADSPEYYSSSVGNRGTWVFPLDCEGLKTSTPWTRLRGRIQVRIPGSLSEKPFRIGGRICFSGTLRKRNYPGEESVELVVPTSKDWNPLAGHPALSPMGWIQQQRERAAKTLSNGVERHPTQLAVFKALMLGYRKAIPVEIIQQFRRTGTMHIFAISGLHVGMVGLLITVVLKTVGVPRDKWGLWLLPLLLVYVCATGMKSSALRALTMATVYFCAPLFRRKPDVPNAIAFAAILLLFIHPQEILSAGFIFSFTVVSFLVMAFAGPPGRLITKGGGWLGTVRNYVASLGITSAAAFIASIPLTALFFGSFSTVSLIGNLVVVPLTFCVVLSGWLSLLVPIASGIFNHAALVFINGLLGTVAFLSGLPGSSWNVPPPPLLAVLVWYIGWIHLFTHARTAPQRYLSVFLIALALAATTIPVLL
ncbi:MAG: ComEC/Rec2 family competence protein [Kiritimatiellales bacterium]|nr:ComEC/Rec2 family competence protein [Kiritimatiellales bacterium]MCF7863258.1 ComEC/Rec2 family competence protein [Kiritimatiellales bacterium]